MKMTVKSLSVFLVLVILIVVASLLTSCTSKKKVDDIGDVNPSVTTGSTTGSTVAKPTGTQTDIVDETQIPVFSEVDYFSADVVDKTDQQIRFKTTLSFSEAFPRAQAVDLTNLKKPREDAAVVYVDAEGHIYYVAENVEYQTTGAIYSFDPFNNQWTTLVETDEDHNCSIVCADERYMLWLEDANENWKMVSLHLLDLNTKQSVKIYDYTINPKTGTMYAWLFSSPVIVGDTVYFDDIVGKDAEETYFIKMFSYSIADRKVEVVDDNAKWPMSYQGDAAWLKMASDKKNSLFYSAKTGTCLAKSETLLGTAFTANGDLIVFNDYMSQAVYNHLETGSVIDKEEIDRISDVRVYCYGMKIYKDNVIQPLLVVPLGFITNPCTNGDLVGWSATMAGSPMMYSAAKDALIEFDDVASNDCSSYRVVLSEGYLYLSYGTMSGETYAYVWNLNNE